MQEALQKIHAELAANSDDKYVRVVGGMMINHIRRNPQHAENIMTEGKTIAGSIDAMKAEARKNQSNGVGMLTDEEGFEVVLKYFSIEVRKAPEPVAAGFSVKLDDLL